MSRRLKRNKLRALTVDRPDVIATANIGCQMQLSQGVGTPVVHWVELL
jgi:glycolate oxidase iron-sulfur subunit